MTKDKNRSEETHPALISHFQRIFSRIKSDFGDSPLSGEEMDNGELTLGDYKILRKIGEGGMASVFEAEQTSLKRKVALKLLASHLGFSDEAVRKFKREAEASGRSNHPNIVAIHTVGEHKGQHYIAQELVNGGLTLADHLDGLVKGDSLPVGYFREVAEMIEKTARALEHAHANGVIHRDVKPSNIMITEDKAPKVADFGLALVEDALAMSRTKGIAGTPYYMSPEQATGDKSKIDHQTDIYSLGVTLYESMTLNRPFEGDTPQEVLKKILLHEPKDPRKISPKAPSDLSVICMKAMEKDKKNRYASMKDFADDLKSFLSGEVIQARPVTFVGRTIRRVKRNPAMGIAALVSVIAAFLLLFVAPWMLVEMEKDKRIAVEAEENKKKKALEDLQRMHLRFVDIYHESAGLRLIAEAKNLLDVKPDVALIYAYEGVKRFPCLDGNNVILRSLELCRQTHVLTGAYAEVSSAVFSPDNKKALAGFWDHTAFLYDLHSQKEALLLKGHQGGVTCVDFSPDGELILTGASDGLVCLWSANTGKMTGVLDHPNQIVLSARFSPDGKTILSATNRGKVLIWNKKTKKLIHDFQAHDQGVYSICFHPEGGMAATASMDKTVKLWSIDNSITQKQLMVDAGMINSVAFSSDGNLIITSNDDNTAVIWNADSCESLQVLKGHEKPVTDAVFHKNNRLAATVSMDKTLRVWDVKTGDQISVIKGHGARINSVRFSSDGTSMITASDDRTARIWSLGTRRGVMEINDHGDEINTAFFDSKGQYVITASDDKTAKIWDGETGEPLTILQGHEDFVNMARFDAKGQYVITASDDKTARVWDRRTGNQVSILSGHDGFVTFANFSGDGAKAITDSDDDTIRIWDVQTGAVLQVLYCDGNKPGFSGLDHKGDFAFSARQGRISVWNCATGEEAAFLKPRTSGSILVNVQFSPDGREILAVHREYVCIWDWMSETIRIRFRGHEGSITSGSFSNDGNWVVTTSLDKTARIWDSKTGEEIKTLKGHQRSVQSAAISSDKTMAITGSMDKTARLWDLKTGQEIVTYTGHLDGIRWVCFSMDNKKVLSLGEDQTVRIWRIDLKDVAKALVTRTLTDEERNRFHAKNTDELLQEQEQK